MRFLSYGVFTLGVLGIALIVAVLRLDAKAPLNRAVASMAAFSSVWAFCLVVVYASCVWRVLRCTFGKKKSWWKFSKTVNNT